MTGTCDGLKPGWVPAALPTGDLRPQRLDGCGQGPEQTKQTKQTKRGSEIPAAMTSAAPLRERSRMPRLALALVLGQKARGPTRLAWERADGFLSSHPDPNRRSAFPNHRHSRGADLECTVMHCEQRLELNKVYCASIYMVYIRVVQCAWASHSTPSTNTKHAHRLCIKCCCTRLGAVFAFGNYCSLPSFAAVASVAFFGITSSAFAVG